MPLRVLRACVVCVWVVRGGWWKVGGGDGGGSEWCESCGSCDARSCSGQAYWFSPLLMFAALDRTHIFSSTMPFAMHAPPNGLAFMAVTECDLQ